jgi:hypothetical protein
VENSRDQEEGNLLTPGIGIVRGAVDVGMDPVQLVLCRYYRHKSAALQLLMQPLVLGLQALYLRAVHTRRVHFATQTRPVALVLCLIQLALGFLAGCALALQFSRLDVNHGQQVLQAAPGSRGRSWPSFRCMLAVFSADSIARSTAQ